MTSSDVITLAGMQFYGRHGADEGERVLGQRFEVDVELEADLARPGRSDELTDAVDYRAVYECIARRLAEPCRRLEAVAERLAADILAGFAVRAVVVRVRKASVPIGGVLAFAEVQIRREDSDR